jgi:hypothetical protein
MSCMGFVANARCFVAGMRFGVDEVATVRHCHRRYESDSVDLRRLSSVEEPCLAEC